MIFQNPRSSQPLPNFPPERRLSTGVYNQGKHERNNSSHQKQIITPVKSQKETDLQEMKKRLNSLLQKTEFVLNKQKVHESPPNNNRIHQNHEESRKQQEISTTQRPCSFQPNNTQSLNQNRKIPETQRNAENHVVYQERGPDTNQQITILYEKQRNGHHQKERIEVKNPRILEMSAQFQKNKNQNIPKRVESHEMGLAFSPRKVSQPQVIHRNQKIKPQIQQHQNPQKNTVIEMLPQNSKQSSPVEQIKLQKIEHKSIKQSMTIEKQHKWQPKPLRNNIGKKQENEGELSWTKFISLQIKNEQLQKIINEADRKFNEKSEMSKREIEQKQQTIKHLSKKLYETKKDYDQRITRMNSDFQDKIKQKNSHIKKLVSQLSGLSLEEKDKIFKDKIFQVMEDNKNLKIQMAQTESKISELQGVLNMKTELLQEKESRGVLLQKQLEILLQEKQRRQSGLSFDENIKIQFDSIGQLKQKIQLLQDENYNLKDNLRNTQHELEKIQNQKRINQVKESSIRNRLVTEMGIKLTQKQNKIQTLEKKMITLSQKYKGSIRQIKSKDEFLQNYLKGRTDEVSVKEHIQCVLKKYVQKFEECDEGEIDNLEAKIKHLNLKLNYYEQNW